MQNTDPNSLDRGPVKLNPAPKHAYEITLRIADAPGPFAVVEGSAQYVVTNHEDCGYIDQLPGVIHRISSLEPFQLKKISDSEYKGIIYLDYMQDENYYGRAVCHWELSAVSGFLRATGADIETRFLPGIDREQILAETSSTTYFWRGFYPKTDTDDYPDIGTLDPNKVDPKIRDELFSITLTARKVTP